MFEARNYIEDKSQINRDLLLRYQEAEKSVERARKQVRYERKKRLEQELIIAR